MVVIDKDPAPSDPAIFLSVATVTFLLPLIAVQTLTKP